MKLVTIKTADLTGAALDWAVAFAADWKPILITDEPCENYFACQDFVNHGYSPLGAGGVSPSTDWTYGGPIIERERIVVMPRIKDNSFTWFIAMPMIKDGEKLLGLALSKPSHGATYLQAAMRCYVAAKLGEQVDVPEVLV